MITELSRVHPVSKVTKVLMIPKSTYYYRKKNGLTPNKLKREKLSKLIYEIWIRSHKRYGAPKIHQELIKLGEVYSLKHIQNLMSEKDIRSITVKKFRPQGGNKEIDESKVPNILVQDFNSETAYRKIVGDITYIHTKQDGWCYLSSYMDLYNNEILGWSFSKEMTTKIVIESLEMACLKMKNTEKVIVHTDRGSQYTSNIYRELIEKKKMKGSYSRKGNPYDNACIESFHSVLKKELIHQREYRNFEEVNEDIIEFIEGWYNKRRIQKKLDWKSPIDYKKCS